MVSIQEKRNELFYLNVSTVKRGVVVTILKDQPALLKRVVVTFFLPIILIPGKPVALYISCTVEVNNWEPT